MNRKRKGPKVQWVILYHGAYCTFVTETGKPTWDTRKGAQKEADRLSIGSSNYEVVKFIRAK